MNGRNESPLFEETEEDKAYFDIQMANIAHLSDDQRALIGVTKRCVCCGYTFAVGGSDEAKRRTEVCNNEECQLKLDDHNAGQMYERRAYWRDLYQTHLGHDTVDGW